MKSKIDRVIVLRVQWLFTKEQARAIRSQIATRVGGLLPDSVQELQELREERDAELRHHPYQRLTIGTI